MSRKDFVTDVYDQDWAVNNKPIKAPEGRKFIVIGRVDDKHRGGNSWQGLRNMVQGKDWHVQQPALIVDEIPQGKGWIYRLKREL